MTKYHQQAKATKAKRKVTKLAKKAKNAAKLYTTTTAGQINAVYQGVKNTNLLGGDRSYMPKKWK